MPTQQRSNEAATRLRRALAELETENVTTTAEFHEVLLQNKKFLSGEFTTKFLDEELDNIKAELNKNDETLGESAALALAISVASTPADSTPNKGDSRPRWIKRAREEGVTP